MEVEALGQGGGGGREVTQIYYKAVSEGARNNPFAGVGWGQGKNSV